jgi:pilus assembly protein CpaB
MHLDRRFAIITAISLTWGLVVSTVFYRMAVARVTQRPTPERELVVAAEALPPGALLEASSVKVVHVPEYLYPKGGFARVEEVTARPVISPIETDEPVLETKIAARGSGFGLAPMIPPGMRAVSVRVNDVAGVAGLVLPGMRVDVLVTVQGMTTTVLQNITVLSAGQTIQADAKSQPVSVPVVTLLATPAESEALTLANSEGRIQLVLRNSTDRELTRTPGRQLREFYTREDGHTLAPPAGSTPAPRPPARDRAEPERLRVLASPAVPAIRPPSAGDSVVILLGDRRTVETFTPALLPAKTVPAEVRP